MVLSTQQSAIIQKIIEHLREEFGEETTGHDFWHMYRVWQNAKAIQKKEGGDLFIVELGALLHDIADWKFHKEEEGPRRARVLLEKLGVEENVIKSVCYVVDRVSFKGGRNEKSMDSIEVKIVQDADRLDALGAIGIGRAFAYGGNTGRAMHNPKISPKHFTSFEEYKQTKGTTINHFYEKLLLLKDRCNTATGKQMAEKRHVFLERFLEEFLDEWEGKR